ncbi:MAG TPA: hypothetical protein VK698_02190 [Kofleriaceae bacterium]|nr:hypothetical protein [Kofleriaceae bacterium]
MAFLDWWVPEESSPSGEVERLTALANFSVSAWRAVGGRLIATDRTLLFRPTRLERKLGQRVWRAPLSSIRAVGKKPPTGGLFNGGLRTRLRVVTQDDVEHLFVVNKLDALVTQLDALVRSAGPTPGHAER